MGLVVGFIFDAFKAAGRAAGCAHDGAQVGDGVGAVLEVETVAGWVEPVDGRQPVEMVLPRLVCVEGVHPPADAARYMVYCWGNSCLRLVILLNIQ